jgi:hypothetical protein
VPVFQFTFFTDNGPDVYIVTDAVTWLEAAEALTGAREFELPSPRVIVEIAQITTNSVIRVGDQLLRVEGE